jgi:conjugative relaxase-like TrwC/TraI family protein
MAEQAPADLGVEYRRDAAPQLAKLLGINAHAAPKLKDLEHLLSAKAASGEPVEGKRPYRTTGTERQTMGSLELVFSADKSISAVYALASPDERHAIVAAQRGAVDAAMHQIAGKIGHLRARRNGLDRQDPADLTWIQWQHRMSRRGDPQLHTHVSVPNIVRSRVDGKVGTIDTFALHGFYPIVRETYHRALTAELGKLGMAVEFDARVPAAVLTNVPESVLRHFSSRTADAAAAAAEYLQKHRGVSFDSLTPSQRSAWLGRAAAATRPAAGMFYVPGNGHAAWHARAVGQGYVPPPQFINPQILQRAGLVHATAGQAQQAAQHAQQSPAPASRKQRSETRRQGAQDAIGEHKQRGWWKYDELYRGHGLNHGHKM